jgi:methyl-accepting chemotaxis protein
MIALFSLTHLSLRVRLGLGLAAMVLILAGVVVTTIHRVDSNLDQTRNMTAHRIPMLETVDDLVRAVQGATSALRGWVLTGDPHFRDQRQAYFDDTIEPALQAMRQLLDRAPFAESTDLPWIEQSLRQLRDLQESIETLAHQPDNVPAERLFIEHAAPEAEIMADTLGKMISLEKFEAPNDLRRQILLALAETQGAVTRAVSSIRAYLLTGDDAWVAEFDTHWTRARTRKQELFMVDFAFTQEQQGEWQAFSNAYRAFAPQPAEIFALRAQADWNRARHRLQHELLPAQRTLSERLLALRLDQVEALSAEAAELVSGNRNLIWISWGMLGAGVLLAIVIGASVNRSVLRSVRELADVIRLVQEEGCLYRRATADTKDDIGLAAKAFNGLTASWQQMVLSVNAFVGGLVELGEETRAVSVATLDNVQAQRERTRSIAEALRKLQDMVERITQSAQSNAASTQRADTEANASMRIVTGTRHAIAALSQEMGEAGEQVARLHDDSSRIGDVLQVVQDIADQTNLLALNAAIEAARAGEVGRGFAVVADEVRTLARRTQESVNGVGETVANVQQRVAAVVDAIERGRTRLAETESRSADVEQALARIVEASAMVKGMNDEILEAVLNKQRLAQEISDSAGEINLSGDRTVQQVEQAVDTARRLAEVSSNLDQLFAEFRVVSDDANPDRRGSRAERSEAQQVVELF